MMDQDSNRAMAEAGISREVWDKDKVKLSDLGEGGTLLSGWLIKDGLASISHGNGVMVVGKTVKAHRAFHLLARGVLLGLHQNTRILSLPRLVDFLRDKEAYTQLTDIDALFVEGFYSDHYGKNIYMEHIGQLEWLLQWFLNRKKVLFLQSTTPAKDCIWWSPMLTSRLMERVREVQIL